MDRRAHFFVLKINDTTKPMNRNNNNSKWHLYRTHCFEIRENFTNISS